MKDCGSISGAVPGRGVHVVESRSREPEDYVSLVTSRVTADGEERTIAGTLFGRSEARIVRMDKYRLEFAPSGYMLVARHLDLPGMIGRVGSILGRHNINIAGMHVGRRDPGPGGPAVMVLALDDPIPPHVMEELLEVDGMTTAQLVEL